MFLEETAEMLDTKRARDIERRNIKRLLKYELLEERDGGYVPPDDVEERLSRELAESGCLEAEERQRERYERERELWRKAANEEPDGYISELEPVDESLYLDPEGLCIHGFHRGKGCYLCDPDHWYRAEMEVRTA